MGFNKRYVNKKIIKTVLSEDGIDALINFIVKTEQPISIVESSDFKAFIKTLNNSYKLPSRKTVKHDLVPELVCKFNTFCFTFIIF